MGSKKKTKKMGWQLIAVAVGGELLGITHLLADNSLKIELRPRTDPHVQDDIRAAREYQQRLLTNPEKSGLSALAVPDVPSPSIAAPQATIESPPSASVTIGSRSDPEADKEASQVPHLAPQSGKVDRSAANGPSGVRVMPRSELRMAPPTISAIQGWQPERRLVTETEARSASTSRQWIPVRAVMVNDVEANVKPQLSSPSALVPATASPSIAPANYQATADGMTAPSLPMNSPPLTTPPTMMPASPSSIPAQQQPILPNATSPVMPPPGSYIPTTPAPSMQPLNTVPLNTIPMNPSSLPTYPQRGSTIISGEPFVTGPPCEFDASYMLDATQCFQNPATSSCGTIAPAPYAGIPGNIVPPTTMPNQAPPGLYPPGNSGFRPLIGLGQDNYNIQFGRGIIGQPVAYVPGQPFRNFLRYLFP